MHQSNKLKLLILGVFAIALLGRVSCYFIDKKYDNIRRPWAYSEDPNKALLVGKWQGSVADPDGIQHKVRLEIVEPKRDEERWKRFSQKRIKRDRSSAVFFDGTATLEVNNRKIPCEIWGGLDTPDGRLIHFQFRPIDDRHPPGFNLKFAEGTWLENALELDIGFVFFRPDGSSFQTAPIHGSSRKVN